MRATYLKSTTVLTGLLLSFILTSCSSAELPVESKYSGEHLRPYTAALENRQLISPYGIDIVDATHLEITTAFSGDGSKCDRYDAEVEETDETVTVNFYHGRLLDADTICKDEAGEIIEFGAREASMLVETAAPIGDRTIIDGSTGDVATSSPSFSE